MTVKILRIVYMSKPKNQKAIDKVREILKFPKPMIFPDIQVEPCLEHFKVETGCSQCLAYKIYGRPKTK